MRSTIVNLWKSSLAALALAACASAPQSQPDPQPTAAAWPKPASSAPAQQSAWPSVRQTQPQATPSTTTGSAHDGRAPLGCFQGHAYLAASALTLPLDYTRAPVAELQACSLSAQLSANSMAFEQARAGSAYVLRYQGKFAIIEPGRYTFNISSATPWRLRIDDVVFHERSENTTMQLTGGPHRLVLEYYYPAGPAFAFDLQLKSPQGVEKPLSVEQDSAFRISPVKKSPNNSGLASAYAHVDDQSGQITLQSQIQFASYTRDEIELDQSSKYLVQALAETLLEHKEIARLRVECSCVAQGWSRAAILREELIWTGVPPHRVIATCVGLPSDNVEISQGLGSDLRFVIEPSLPASIVSAWTPRRAAKVLLDDLKAFVASKLGLTSGDILGSAQLSVDDWYQVYVNPDNSRSSPQGWRLGLSYSPDGSRHDLGVFEHSTPLAWTAGEAARLGSGKVNATLYGHAGHFSALVQLHDNVYASISHASRAELVNFVLKLEIRELQNFVRASYSDSTAPMYEVKQSGDPTLTEELLALVGTSPSDMFKRPQLDKQLKRVLGKNYSAFKARWDLASPIARRGDYVIGEGMMAHQGGSEEAYFAFGVVRGDIHCGVRVLERLKVFSSPGTKPPAEFHQVLGAGEARGRALFGK